MLVLGVSKHVRAVACLGLSALSLGCGGAALPPASTDPALSAAEAPTVYVILQPVDEGTPVVEGTPGGGDGWVPDTLSAQNPFYQSAHWTGDYDCRQGNTDLSFRILDVRGHVVRAIFDFHHFPSGAKGSYIMRGTYDADTHKAHFEPSQWIIRPDNYYMVGMEGEVSLDNSLFAGKITDDGCGAFQLKPGR